MKRPTSRLRSGCSRTGAQMIWNRQATGMRADFPVCPLPTEFARSALVGEAGHALPFAAVELRGIGVIVRGNHRAAVGRELFQRRSNHPVPEVVEGDQLSAPTVIAKRSCGDIRHLAMLAGVFAPVEDDRLPPDNPKFNPPGMVPKKSQRYQEKSQGQRCCGNRTRLRSGAVGVCSVSGRHLVSLAERKCAEPGSRPRSISRNSVRRLRSERGARS
jgi:hypothetical protein